MEETPATSLNDRIAQRVRDLRATSGLSLDALATHCGISRSMISLIERGESSPTAVLLEKLASGLGVPLAALFDAPRPSADPVARAADQPSWGPMARTTDWAPESRRRPSWAAKSSEESCLPRLSRSTRCGAARPA